MTAPQRPHQPADFELLDSVARIACLANEHRLAILGELIAGAKTGSQVAKSLGLASPLVHYHLGRLLEHGFVVETSEDEANKERSSERYFRACARHLFVDPALAVRDDEAARALVASFEQILNAWQRREVFGVDLAAVAQRVIGDALAVQPGERVLIISQPQVREIVEQLFIEVEARGGLPRMRPWSRDYALARVDRFDPSALKSTPFASIEELDELSIVLFISATQSAGSAPTPQQAERMPLLLGALGEWMRVMRARGVRYLELSVPAHGDLEHGDIDASEAMAVFWRSLQSPPAQLAASVESLVVAVDSGASNSSEGTELVLSDEHGSVLRVRVDGTRPHRNIGCLHQEDALAGHLAEELPPGSVAWFPMKDSGEGELCMPYVVVRGQRFRQVTLKLKRGRIQSIHGDDVAGLRDLLAQAAGDADALAEIRIGVNPAGAGLTGKASLDAVLHGSVTLAFGSNEVLGGTRRATLDLRFPSRSLAVTLNGDSLLAD